uniref:Sine oculis binding protein homolog n=1 Tax=Meloidogyne hapla TaxID=6305 RepID=A0A1I8BPI0_MELHA
LFCQSESAISPLFDPISVQDNNRQLVSEWEEYLKNKQQNNQKSNGNGYYVLIEKPQSRINSHPKVILEKRGDEKRRDFEHGWEQCEVS